jgi:hypothetical protein
MSLPLAWYAVQDDVRGVFKGGAYFALIFGVCKVFDEV